MRQRLNSNAEQMELYRFADNKDYKQYKLRNVMTKMYRNYYALWIDFDILFSLLALAGLMISIQEYQETFEALHKPSSKKVELVGFGSYYNLLLLFFTFVCGIVRQRMRSFWNHYRLPFNLIKVLNKNVQQDEDGPIVALDVENKGLMKQAVSEFYAAKTFIIEMAILLI